MQAKKCGIVFYSATLLLISIFTSEVFASSNALVRFTYKLHSELALPEFQSAYIKRLNQELNLVCPSEAPISLSKFENTPNKLVRRVNSLFQARANQCLHGQDNLNNLESLVALKQHLSNFTENRYIVFASESTLRMESSLGHIAILYLEPENLFFSPTVSFSADGIHETEGSLSSIEYYFKGGFSHLEGEVRINYFFDHYWDLVKQDGRYLEKYKIIDNKQNLLIRFDELIIKSIGVKKNYNFFSANCSTELFNMLLEAKEEKIKVDSFEPPAKHLTKLIELGHIEYESTILHSFEDIKLNYYDQNHLKNSNIYPSHLEAFNDTKYTNLSFFLYQKNRPWNGYQEKFEVSRMGGIFYEQEQSKGGLTLLEQSTIQNYKTDGISSFLRVDYRNSLNAYYYAGYGLYSNGLGAATSIGCNIKRGCGVLASVIYSHGTHDLQLSYLADRYAKDLSFHYLAQISQRLSMSFKYQYKKSWLGLGLKF